MVTMILVFLVTALIIIYKFVIEKHNYWDGKNVAMEKSSFLFGSYKKFTFAIKSMIQIEDEIYRKHKTSKCVGIYFGVRPKLLLRDPILIKQVLVENFNSFQSRGIYISKDDFLADSVLFMDGIRWRLTRQRLTTFFTPAKLKNMVPLIKDCADQLILYLNSAIENKRNFDYETTLGDYTATMISSIAFGIDTKTLSSEYSPFREAGRNFFDDNIRLNILISLENMFPWLFKMIGFKKFRSTDEIFFKIFKKALQQREHSNKKRKDFIDTCLDMKKEKILNNPTLDNNDFSVEVTDEFLSAQAFFFLLAGLETTATALAFVFYELAHNPDVLEKVHNEINVLIEKHVEITYDCIDEAHYIENVVLEGLRKYPPIGNLERQCNVKSFAFKDSDITIDKGVNCIVPVYSLHRDPKYFPDPLKFNPDRFEGRKQELDNSYYYLPLGNGPRNCLGKRLALLQIKSTVFMILRHFTIKGTEPYDVNLEMKPIFLSVKAKNINVEFVPITRKSRS